MTTRDSEPSLKEATRKPRETNTTGWPQPKTCYVPPSGLLNKYGEIFYEEWSPNSAIAKGFFEKLYYNLEIMVETGTIAVEFKEGASKAFERVRAIQEKLKTDEVWCCEMTTLMKRHERVHADQYIKCGNLSTANVVTKDPIMDFLRVMAFETQAFAIEMSTEQTISETTKEDHLVLWAMQHYVTLMDQTPQELVERFRSACADSPQYFTNTGTHQFAFFVLATGDFDLVENIFKPEVDLQEIVRVATEVINDFFLNTGEILDGMTTPRFLDLVDEKCAEFVRNS
ncbi:hypothetical protein KKE45_02990 [Patescibacteria group bacterium]|nr:hypothetical protein [Patescibacteria group bacterium]